MPRKNGKSAEAIANEALLKFCDKHAEDHQHIRDALTKSEVQMTELREDVVALRPKKGDRWVKYTLYFMALTSLIGGLWFLSDRFNERPTQSMVEKMVQPIQADVKEIKDTLPEHRVMLQELKDSLKDIQQDLKDIKQK